MNNFTSFSLHPSSWFRSVVTGSIMLVLTFIASVATCQTIKGKVSTSNGEPIIGATVIEDGNLKNGTITDIDGNFAINVSKIPTGLQVSYIGYGTKLLTVNSSDEMVDISLEEGSTLDEVVVTALGISRQKKSLTYALDEVKGEVLTTYKDANVVNQLQGRSAGVFVGRSGSGIGGSTRVTIRGNKSSTNNSPLYVIDGVPMNNSNGGGQSGAFGGGVDVGDGISNINPED